MLDVGIDVDGLIRRPAGPLNWAEMNALGRRENDRVYGRDKPAKRKTPKQAPTLYD